MSNKALTFIAGYFRQFFTQKGSIRLIVALLLMIVAFKFNSTYVDPHQNIEMLLLIISGIIPFLFVTIIKKYRFSLPLSLFAILLVYFCLSFIYRHSL